MRAAAEVDFYYPTRHRLRHGVLIHCFFANTTPQTRLNFFLFFFAHFSLT